ncbi:hypothetical protein FRB98_006996 [Tulasnella sp. 332]|nr:hypothetical protein FRB98_006996 [Tulasnella sp. 332]
MLLTLVVVGKAKKFTQETTDLISPPKGYDSVIDAIPDFLQCDEAVVYNSNAIAPAWLVMYGSGL